MRSLITGVAGFIGSHLAERLLAEGHQVVGVDNFLDNYPVRFKKENLKNLLRHPQFQWVNEDIVRLSFGDMLNDISHVFHLAAQPGVRSSWGRDFYHYTQNNIQATQVILEACKGSSIKKFVYASSSSVYGDTDDLPMRETGNARPVSPYGVSKLAAEHLCYLYWKAYAVPTVSLRFFTVYGPRQRPDMFFHIFMKGLRRNEETPLYDDGAQTRDFTYCSDIIEGLLRAALYPGTGEVFNLGGGAETSLLNAIRIIEKLSGKKSKLRRFERQRGDVRHTSANLDLAAQKLDYHPKISLEEGLFREWEWIEKLEIA